MTRVKEHSNNYNNNFGTIEFLTKNSNYKMELSEVLELELLLKEKMLNNSNYDTLECIKFFVSKVKNLFSSNNIEEDFSRAEFDILSSFDLDKNDLYLRSLMQHLEFKEALFESFLNDIQDMDISKDKPVFFLILNKAGISIYSRIYVRKNVDDQLVSGFITAINQIGKAVFSYSPGNIDSIIFENYSIKILHDEFLNFVYSFSGHSFFANNRLKETVKKLKECSQWNNLVIFSKKGKVFSNQDDLYEIDKILDKYMGKK